MVELENTCECPTNVLPFYFSSLTTNSGGCSFPQYVGDGYCDDGNNNQECNFDGGDCCGPNVNTEYCTECQCLSEGGLTGENGSFGDSTIVLEYQDKTLCSIFEQ